MGEHDEVTPHLARSARHPLPKGEGRISYLDTPFKGNCRYPGRFFQLARSG
jgi:hypothetical protein